MSLRNRGVKHTSPSTTDAWAVQRGNTGLQKLLSRLTAPNGPPYRFACWGHRHVRGWFMYGISMVYA